MGLKAFLGLLLIVAYRLLKQRKEYKDVIDECEIDFINSDDLMERMDLKRRIIVTRGEIESIDALLLNLGVIFFLVSSILKIKGAGM